MSACATRCLGASTQRCAIATFAVCPSFQRSTPLTHRLGKALVAIQHIHSPANSLDHPQNTTAAPNQQRHFGSKTKNGKPAGSPVAAPGPGSGGGDELHRPVGRLLRPRHLPLGVLAGRPHPRCVPICGEGQGVERSIDRSGTLYSLSGHCKPCTSPPEGCAAPDPTFWRLYAVARR